MVSKSADPLTRDRGFESGSLHRRVLREPEHANALSRLLADYRFVTLIGTGRHRQDSTRPWGQGVPLDRHGFGDRLFFEHHASTSIRTAGERGRRRRL